MPEVLVPGGFENQFCSQRAPSLQAVSHGLETLQGKRLELSGVEPLNGGWQRGEKLGKGLSLGDRFAVGVGQRVIHIGIVLGDTVVDLAYHIRDRQDPRLGTGQQVIDVTNFLPLEIAARWQCRMPVFHQVSTGHRIERRNVLAHVIDDTILRPLGRIVFLDFLVTTVVVHAMGERQIHQAIAVAHAVVLIRLQEVHGLGQRIVQDEVIVGRQHHIRRGQLLHTISQFGLHAPVGELRHMVIIDGGKIPLRPLDRRVEHHDPAGQAAVILHRPTQERRPIVSNQHHGQQLVER